MFWGIIALSVTANDAPCDAFDHGLEVKSLGSILITSVVLVVMPSSRALLSRYIQAEVTLAVEALK